MNERLQNYQINTKDSLKFAVFSFLGVFLFLVPIPTGGAFNIPIGLLVNRVSDFINFLGARGGFNLAAVLVLVFLTLSVIGTVLAHTVKPDFLMKDEKVRDVFLSTPIYTVSRIVGMVFVYMIFFQVGPEPIIAEHTGEVILGLGAALVSIFLVLAFAMPLLTDFGIMEFVGILIRKAVRFLFTVPGRSSIDLMASWFGSSALAVLLTRGQQERGFYTGREAAAICVNFSVVSVPFSFVVARTVGLESHFVIWYIIITITCMLLAVIMPRIWPLSKLPDEYLKETGKQIDENIPENVSSLKWAVTLAGERASRSSAKDVARTGLHCYLNVFMDLIPLILAWGTIAVILVEFTPIFNVISLPMGWFMSLFGIEGAMAIAHTTLIGFIDMYLPALMLGEAAIETRFIVSALSIVQIIYMAETGILILKSHIPLKLWHLMVIFMMRTLFAIPVITLLTRLFVNL